MSVCKSAVCAGLIFALWSAPSQARFLQSDPVGYSADANLYTYASNDPANRVDPTGKDDVIRDEVVQEMRDAQILDQCGGNGQCIRQQEQKYADEDNRTAVTQIQGMLLMATPEIGAAAVDSFVARFGLSEAFDEAVLGIRNEGFLRNYLGKTAAQLEKGIGSLEKQIAEHEAKLADPAQYVKDTAGRDWETMDPREKEGLVNHWTKEIENFVQQRNILQDLQKLRQICTGSRIPGPCF